MTILCSVCNKEIGTEKHGCYEEKIALHRIEVLQKQKESIDDQIKRLHENYLQPGAFDVGYG